MYETVYKLSADPFRLSPDPGFSFRHRTYHKAMTYMLHALRRAEGFVMVTGQPGTGKSTLVSDLVSTLNPDQIAVTKIVSTQLTSNDLLNLVAYSFDLDPEGWSKAKVLVHVERYLKAQYQQGRHPLLIIDEAQGMDEDALEELRLLTNLLVGNQQLLQVFLVGQEELRDTVSTPSLEQLRQRLIATTFLEPLNVDDTRAYIKHRLHCVNWKGDPLISMETYALIQRYSQGIPRRINQICSRLFLHGSIEEKHRLGTADLNIVIEELQQELLLPMDTESVYEAVSSPMGRDEETYEEEPRTSPAAPKTVPPRTKTRTEAAKPTRQSPRRVADTGPHLPAGKPAAVTDPGTDPDPGSGTVITDDKPAGAHHKIRATVLVLIAILLAAYLSEGDIGQSVPDQDSVALSQDGQQQRVQPTTEDSETISVQPPSEMSAPEEQATNDIGDSTSEAGQFPESKLDPVETPLSVSRTAMDDPDTTPAAAMTSDETSATQREPDQDTPLPAQEVAPLVAPSQGNPVGEAEAPGPVEEPATALPLSKGEKIAALLANGQRSLQQDLLLIPEDESAYHYFQQALELDPESSLARDGIEQIVARYTTLATYALDKDDWQRAERYIARGLRISPNDEDLQALLEQMISPPVNIVPKPEIEDFFNRYKEFITRPLEENSENQLPTDEP